MSRAANDVLAERCRQINDEGWSTEHDDQHIDGSLAKAAACYAHPQPIYTGAALIQRRSGSNVLEDASQAWPSSWAAGWFKRKSRRRDLIIAGALIIAEIERIDRLSATSPPPSGHPAP